MVRVAGYQDLRLIGRGATAQVYQAVQISTGQSVALKVLNIGAEAWDGARSDKRFARELQLCAQLHHPNIVRLMDQGSCEDGAPYAVFEYLPGQSLSRFIAQNGPLRPSLAKDLMLQVLDALNCAHQSGIIHRDLKPDNLMVTGSAARPTVKVLDFGIGAWSNPVQIESQERLTLAHESLGTPAYCAREQLLGRLPGPEADLFSWGLIFLECLTGTVIYGGVPAAQIIHRQLSDEPIAVPPHLAQHPIGGVLRDVLSKDPGQRESNAAALLARLAALNVDNLLVPTKGQTSSRPLSEDETEIFSQVLPAHDGELRLITLLCCKLDVIADGSRPLDPETQEQVLAEKLALCRELLSRLGGHLAGTLGSGIMVSFGYPHQSEQDARLATRTSLDLRRAVGVWNRSLTAQGLRCVVQQSIHSGVVPVMNDKPQMTDLSNTALAMLFLAAGGEILVSEASQKLLRGQATLALAPRNLTTDRGGEQALFLLHEDSGSMPSGGTRLIGRQRELVDLMDLWRDARGTSEAVSISGDAGLGKSTLLDGFLNGIEEGRVLSWRCLPEYRHSALYPILTGIEQCLGLPGLETDAARRDCLSAALETAGVKDPNCLEVLCFWLNVPGAQPDQRQLISPERQRYLLEKALRAVIGSLGQGRPVVLAIEDCHWLDQVSHDFLKTLRDQIENVFLVVTLRPSDTDGDQFGWISHRVDLRPLDNEASRRLAEALLGQDDPDLLGQVVARGGGVPLFIEELAQSRHQTWQQRTLPLSLMEVLSRRINAAGEAKRVLQWAAVLGGDIQEEELAPLLDQRRDLVQAQLERLAAVGLLELAQPSPKPIYRFAHALYRDAAHQQIPAPLLRHMHGHVGDHLAAKLALEEIQDAALVARHYAQGARFDDAARFSLLAVRDLLGRALSSQALEMVVDLLDWSEHLPETERFDVQLQAHDFQTQALTHQRGWAHPSVLEAVRQTQDFMRRRAPHSTYKIRVATLWSLGTFYHVSSQRDEVHEIAAELVRLADTVLDDGAAMMGHCLHGVGHWIDGALTQSADHLEQVRALYDPARHGDLARENTLDVYVWASSAFALVRWSQGHGEDAHRHMQEAQDRARAMGHMPSLGIALMYQSFLHHYEQDRTQAEAVALDLLGLAETYGLSAVQGYASAMLGWSQDDLDRIMQTLGLLKMLGCLLGVTYVQSMGADVALRLGDGDKAQALLNEALETAERVGERYYLAPLYQQKAYGLLQAQAPLDSTLQCLERARRLSDAQGMRPDGFWPLVQQHGDHPKLQRFLHPAPKTPPQTARAPQVL